MEVEIFGASWCPHCEDSKRLCESQQIPVTYHDVTDEPDKLVALQERLGHEVTSIPQIFVDGVYLASGSDGLSEKILANS